MTTPAQFLAKAMPGILIGIAGAAAAAEGEPPFERLVVLNAKELFGLREIKLEGDRVTLSIKGPAFNTAFQHRSTPARGFVANVDEVKSHVMLRQLLHEAEDVFSCIGAGAGTAVSKFELADDVKIKFQLKAAGLSAESLFSIRVNQQDSKSFIQSDFFHSILVFDDGKKRRKFTHLKQFQADPPQWFPRDEAKGIPVEILFKDRKLSVFLEMKESRGGGGGGGRGGGKRRRAEGKEEGGREKIEVVAQDGIESPAGGKIVFTFNKMSFLLGNLEIQGKINKAWAEEALDKLRKENKLKVKEEPRPEDVAAKETKGKDAKKPGSKVADGPDPEADDEL